jgi:RNA polymerase sigma-70 factor (ECF subfamily)
MRARHHRMSTRSDALDDTPLPAMKGPSPERLAESAQVNQFVNHALGHLTPIERAAFTLRHHEGHSIEEICDTLHLGKSAAKHAVFRAVRKLRAALAPFRDLSAGMES